MPRTIPVRAGSKSERPPAGPKPFSQEWLQTPPELRLPPPRRIPSMPSWAPSERVIAAVLVLFLVLTIAAGSGGPAPDTTATIAVATRTVSEITQVTATTVVVVPPPTTTPAPSATQAPDETPSVIGQTGSPGPTESPPGAVEDPRALLPNYRIVSYYGHPANDQMGILGEFDKEELLAQLLDEAKAFEQADPSRPVMPAFELISSVAQNWPADDDTYLLHTDEATIQSYVEFARANGIILILDLQIGHSTVAAEIQKVSKWLDEPFVHIALDPEFAMAPGDIPGTVIGSLDASDIAVAQEMLSQIVAAKDLPPKLLIVHRFTENMITNQDQIEIVSGVQTVIDFDGFGDPASKTEGYDLFLDADYAEFAGIKLFYRNDAPLMQPDDIVSLSRPPDLVIYQ